MDSEIKQRIEQAIERMRAKHSSGEPHQLDDSKFAVSVERADKLAFEGASLEDIIAFLENSGMSESQFLEAWNYIEKTGIKKYIEAVNAKCVELNNSGTKLDKIKEFVNSTKLTQAEKTKIIAKVEELGQGSSGLMDHGKRLLERGKNMGKGALITTIIIAAIVLYFVVYWLSS